MLKKKTLLPNCCSQKIFGVRVVVESLSWKTFRLTTLALILIIAEANKTNFFSLLLLPVGNKLELDFLEIDF